jgi:uncharacterized protein (DUF2235 family)
MTQGARMTVEHETAGSTGSGTTRASAPKTPPRQITLLSDGTGNSAAAVWRTNVWRVFESLDLTDSSRVAIYDDGVGSSSFKPLAILGGAFGYGLKRNVIRLYSFLCRNHWTQGTSDPDPQIYMFGFSRGAYTIRVLISLIDSQGLVPYESEAQLSRDAHAAYRAYRADRYTKNFAVNWIRKVWHVVREGVKSAGAKYERLTKDKRPTPVIHFVGLWDTVAAYGLPMDEMTRGVDLWLWPLELPNRKFHAERIKKARHALSLDDERTTFHPVLWSEAGITPPPPRQDGSRYVEDEQLSQVWFSGVHANVGGGYPDDSLAFVPLYWIMNEAKTAGLTLKKDPPAEPDALKRAEWGGDRDGRLYDSRAGVAGYYRYGPRKMVDLCFTDEVTIATPKIHYSVFERIKNGAHAYAPIVLPQTFEIVDRDGRIVPQSTYEEAALAAARAASDPTKPYGWQQYVRTLFCWRCLAFDLALAAFVFIILWTLGGMSSELSSPFWLAGGLVVLVACGFAGVRLAGRAPAHLPAPPIGAQESIWDLVWRRRVVYFSTVGFSAYLGIFPFIHQAAYQDLSSKLSFLSPIIRLIGSFLPGFVGFWINAYAANPGLFLVGFGGVVATMWWGARVSARIFDAMRTIWSDILKSKRAPSQPNLRNSIYRLRTDECYRSMLWALKRYILPTIFAVLFVYVGFLVIDRPIYAVVDSFGAICPKDDPGSKIFRTDAMCWTSDTIVDANKRYRITLTVVEPWKDGPIDTGPGGYGVHDMTFAKYVTWPLRRSFGQPWFKPIARIGHQGGDEYVLEPALPVGSDVLRKQLVAEFTARTSGRLYLYVNDAIGPPFWFDSFYTGGFGGYENVGTATVLIEPIVSSARANEPGR